MIIDVFHDTVCPWCRIGKQHLKMAIERWNGEEIRVNYRTYFLNENIPPDGKDFRSFMTAKGGGQIPLEKFFDAPRRAGAAVGLTFNFEKISRTPNTLLSHRLIALTSEEDKPKMIDSLYAAYFEHGRDIGDLDVLIDVAAQNGLDAPAIRALLEGDTARDQVLAEAQQARQLGITGVPFFVLNNTFAFSGAQRPETMLSAFEQALQFSRSA